MHKNHLFPALFALSALLLTACGAREPFTEGRRDFDPAEISSVRVDVRDRRVEVLPSEDGQIHIAYFESSKEGYAFTLEDGVLAMEAADHKEWTDFLGGKADASVRTVRLELPPEALEELSVSTTNGDITLPALSVHSASAAVAGGDILLDGLDAQTVALTAKNGDITGSLAGGWDDYAIDCRIKKGESNLPAQKPGGARTLTVSCNNGGIDLSLAAP